MIWIAASFLGQVGSSQYPDILAAERSVRYAGAKKFAIVEPNATQEECAIALAERPIVPYALSAYLHDLGWRVESQLTPYFPAHLMPLYWVNPSSDYRVDLSGEYGTGWRLQEFTDGDIDGVATARWRALDPELEGDSVAELAAALSSLHLIASAEVIAESERRSDADTARANAKAMDGGWADRTEEE